VSEFGADFSVLMIAMLIGIKQRCESTVVEQVFNM